MTLPVALTCGEPAGIGPEITAAAWSALRAQVPMIWLGDPAHLRDRCPDLPICVATGDDPLAVTEDALAVLPVPFGGTAAPGRPQPENAAGVIAAIERAVDLARHGRAGAVVTNPISKQALRDGAGFAYPGHTEFLGALAGGTPVMMLAGPDLRVVPVTVHIALAEVPRVLTAERIVETGRITARALQRDFGIAAPRLAIAGLNPHAGEGGMMGREDAAVITPAVAQLRRDGIDATGPLPADTMFHARARATYDAALCMYHDQALIPLKTLAFDDGVNVTLGLDIIRTSPDHGTAFDIAGTGTARADSLIAAIRMAHALGQTRARA